jgi:heme/copper-type cytochrome/quinol oxidase subunit 2
MKDPDLLLKVLGHQWWWGYEYQQSKITNLSTTIESRMVAESDLVLGSFRLLEVDNRVLIPFNLYIKVLVTSSDVLHS